MSERLRHEFGVSKMTIERWISGVANPHPLMREVIVDYLNTLSDLDEQEKACLERFQPREK